MKKPKSAGKKNSTTLGKKLRSHSTDELAHVIEKLLEMEPKLEPNIQQLLGEKFSDADISKLQRTISKLLNDFFDSYFDSNAETYTSLCRELWQFLRAALALLADQPIEAGRSFAAILRGMMEVDAGLYHEDEEDELGEIVQECVDRLEELIPIAPPERRLEWLEVICDAFLFDLDMGGTGFAIGTEDILVAADEAGWAHIEPCLNAFLSPPSAPARMGRFIGSDGTTKDISIPAKSDWRTNVIVKMKARRASKFGGTEAADALILKIGTPEQKVEVLLKKGDFEGATILARMHFKAAPGLLVGFADQLNKAGEWERAKAWAKEHRLVQWLAAKCLAKNDPDAPGLYADIFLTSPNMESWKKALKVAPEAERENVRTRLWKELVQRGIPTLQFDILVGEKKYVEAVELWPKLNVWSRNERCQKFAPILERTDPLLAAAAWNEFADAQFERKTRQHYMEAAKALAQVKRIWQKEGKGPEWARRIGEIRKKFSNRGLLKKELTLAGP